MSDQEDQTRNDAYHIGPQTASILIGKDKPLIGKASIDIRAQHVSSR